MADKIVFSLNIGYGAFLTLFSLYGFLLVMPEAGVGLILGITVHCLLDNLGHQSVGLPGNGTG
ncbi:MAG: hypothetical protein BAJATHORv1_40179 [Candidatus Thorarchaeota archaeon]|nr:MAG: hypothetical protein BAJATHORv1_40179 [Candidatus Thorarchaeota archaeon]